MSIAKIVKKVKEMSVDIQKASSLGASLCDAIAMGLYDEGYRKQEWISVEERLPECEIGAETEALLFMTSAGRIEAGYFGRGSVWRDVYFRHYRNHVGWDVSDVTYWMPLPPAPKGE